MSKQEIAYPWHPPIPEGYTRIYDDHTHRNFQDFSVEEIEEMRNDPLMKILRECITEEINKEIIKELEMNHV